MLQGSATGIATRTAAMAKAGTHPAATHDREMKRMRDEKVDASAASLARMLFTAAASSLWLGSLWGGRAPTAAQLHHSRQWHAPIVKYRLTQPLQGSALAARCCKASVVVAARAMGRQACPVLGGAQQPCSHWKGMSGVVHVGHVGQIRVRSNLASACRGGCT